MAPGESHVVSVESRESSLADEEAAVRPEQAAGCFSPDVLSGAARSIDSFGVGTLHVPIAPLFLFLVLLSAQSCKRAKDANGLAPDALGMLSGVTSVLVENKRAHQFDCKKIETAVQQLALKTGNCMKNEDCCLVWDLQVMGWDCVAANRSADLSQLRDGLRMLIRNCRHPGRDCDGLEPICRHGRCELKSARTPDRLGGWEPLLEGYPHECPQPYAPAMRELAWNSPEVVLLTDPRTDPRFGIALPDGGKLQQAMLDVCVSEEGLVTGARSIMHLDKSRPALDAMLETKILETWQFKPVLADGQATPFCTKVIYPLPVRR